MSERNQIVKDRIRDILVEISDRMGIWFSKEAFDFNYPEHSSEVYIYHGGSNAAASVLGGEVIKEFKRLLEEKNKGLDIRYMGDDHYAFPKSDLTLSFLDSVFGTKGREKD
jgi:hypothetical protein